MTTGADEQKQLADSLYQRYGRPFEDEHRGEYVAITAEGRTLLGADLREVIVQAKQAFGPGNFVFKIGAQSVGRWR